MGSIRGEAFIKKKAGVPGLQAADLLAYELRWRAHAGKTAPRAIPDALLYKLPIDGYEIDGALYQMMVRELRAGKLAVW